MQRKIESATSILTIVSMPKSIPSDTSQFLHPTNCNVVWYPQFIPKKLSSVHTNNSHIYRNRTKSSR